MYTQIKTLDSKVRLKKLVDLLTARLVNPSLSKISKSKIHPFYIMVFLSMSLSQGF